MKKLGFALTIATLAATLPLVAQTHEGHAAAPTMTTAQKIKLALSAGPADITKNASVMDMGADGKMVELRKGTNGWMCMAQPEAMCLDMEWQNWANA